jgi:hypothetical protein
MSSQDSKLYAALLPARTGASLPAQPHQVATSAPALVDLQAVHAGHAAVISATA